MAAPPIEVLRETGLRVFDDLRAHRETLEATMNSAEEIIQAYEDGNLTNKQREQLPIVISDLKQLIKTQLDASGTIAQIDRSDGSYDNAPIDNQLRILLRQLRSLNIDLNHYFGTRTARKVLAWFKEDLPYWFHVKWEQVKDNLKHAAITVGVPAALAGATVIAGYSWYHGGLMAGLGALGGHLRTVGGYAMGGLRRLMSVFRSDE